MSGRSGSRADAGAVSLLSSMMMFPVLPLIWDDICGATHAADAAARAPQEPVGRLLLRLAVAFGIIGALAGGIYLLDPASRDPAAPRHLPYHDVRTGRLLPPEQRAAYEAPRA